MAFFNSKKMFKSETRLDGKTVIITGANTGIGKETARDIVGRGARVIIACRDVNKAQAAVDEISDNDPAKKEALIVKKLDLASLASVRQFAEEILESEPKIHILINNAGVMACPQSKTADGFEMQFGTNHLGPFLLTNLLLERIKASAPARIINVSAAPHAQGEMNFDDLMLEKNYGPIKAYLQSKLANVLFTRELARRLQGTGVNTYTLHPGAVKTELQRHGKETFGTVFNFLWLRALGPLILVSPKEGAQTSIYCAVAEELNDKTGLYYSDSRERELSAKAKNPEDAKKLWEMSCALVGFEYTDVE